MISFTIDNTGIFIIKYSGIVSYDEVISSMNKFKKLDLDKDLRLLHDTRDAELNISPEDLNELYNFSNIISKQFNSFKTAFVVNNPSNTALSIILLSMKNIRKTNKKSFYSYDVAYNWLQKNRSVRNISMV